MRSNDRELKNGPVKIQMIHREFFRDDRRYCIFSVEGIQDEFLYYSHTGFPLRSLMYGNEFLRQLPGLMEKENLCIECGLGLSVKGGVAIDNGDCISWQCTIKGANRVLSALKEKLGEKGTWIEIFQKS